MVASGYVVAHESRFGHTLRAVGGHKPSALVIGVPVGPAKFAVHGFNGFCAGLAGIVATCSTASGNPSMGLGLELEAIAVVVIGGTLRARGRGPVLGPLPGC